MKSSIEQSLLKIPVVGFLVRVTKKVSLPSMREFSLYDLLETYIVGLAKGTFSSRASGVAFSFFMAIFPFILFVLNLIPFVRIKNFQNEFVSFIDALLPPTTSSFINPIMEDIASNPRGSLLSLTILLAIFFMANGVNAIFSGFEYSFYIRKKRSFIKQYLIAIGVSVFLALVLFASVIGLLVGKYFLINFRDELDFIDYLTWLSMLQYLVLAILIYVIVATLYFFGTSESKQYKFFSVGAVITTLLYLVTTYLFGIYIENFSAYNELYGSIGAMLVLMVYIWINSNLLLLGFELNVTLHRLKTRKTLS